jgi:F-type H+-transporting ATPase subunit epsilon
MDSFSFSLITPEAVYCAEPAREVEAPGLCGEFGVLPGHMDFISALQAGIVRVEGVNGAKKRLFIAGGVAEVNAVSCTILAEEVVDLSSFSRTDAEARLEAARIRLNETYDAPARIQAERAVKLAETLLDFAA